MSSIQDRQMSHAAAVASAGQFGPAVDQGQLALQLYVAALAAEPTPRPAPVPTRDATAQVHKSWSMMDAAVSRVMTTPVVTVSEDASFSYILHALAEHHISAVPVVDARNLVVGVVSEADLLAEVASRSGLGAARRPAVHPSGGAPPWSQLCTARTLMTSPAVTVRPTASLLAAARLAAAARVKRMPVTDSTGVLVGIISRADLIAAVVDNSPAPNQLVRSTEQRNL